MYTCYISTSAQMLTVLHYKVWESLFTHSAPAWRSRFYFSVDFGGPLQMVFHVRRVWKQRMAGPDVDDARPAATCNVLIPSIITCFPEKLIVASPSLPPSHAHWFQHLENLPLDALCIHSLLLLGWMDQSSSSSSSKRPLNPCPLKQ